MLRQLFRTKSLDVILSDSEAPNRQLKRSLGAFDVTMLGIGAIIGAGIFATLGTAAAGDATRPGAGPALIVSFVITAIGCGFAALCYAEFAAMVLHCIHNGYLNGEVIRLDGALRMAPR